MNNICPKCGIGNMQYRPSGVSKKTGNAYPAFLSCTNRACGNTMNIDSQDIPLSAVPTYITPIITPQPVPVQAAITSNKTPQNTQEFYQEAEKVKQLYIIRESVIGSLAKVMKPQDDLIAAARQLMRAADILVPYIYSGTISEDLSDAELDSIFQEQANAAPNS